MISSMVKAQRYARALAISDRSVVEFKIVKNDPLVAYCVIQGSAAEPYVVLIDLKKNIVGHYCPDFAKGREWCKHIGKLLLMLEENHVSAIYEKFRSISIINMQSNVKSQIDKYKLDLLKSNGSDENITLEKQLKILDTMIMENQKVGSIIPAITSSFKKEFSKMDVNLILLQLNHLVAGIPNSSRKMVFEQIQKPLLQYFKKATNHFTKNFWIQSTPKRLEQAYIISDISQALDRPYQISKLSFPENLVEQEKMDASLILKVIFKDNKKKYFTAAKTLGIEYSDEILGRRAERMLSSLKITSTVVPQLETWLQTQVKKKYASATYTRTYEDFLIYMMKTAGETVKHKLQPGNSSGGMATIPVTILEVNPCLKFITDRIKESEREYLLRREMNNHPKFFNWLAGQKVNSMYVEKPRSRALESALKKKGVIIQWDINLTTKFQEHYHAYQGSQRLIIDPTSPIKSIIQPFDYTLCIPQMKLQNDGTKVTFPQQLLLPDQVIKLVLQGVPIISNVLRWNTISKFVNEGYLSGGDVLASIAHSEKMNFIYGSFELANALEEIVILGKAGLTDQQFLDYKTRFSKGAQRMTVSVRDSCREFIQSEGKPLQAVLELLAVDEQGKFRYLTDAIANTDSIESFRKYIVRSITKAYFAGNKQEKTFFEQLESLHHSHYNTGVDVVSDQLSIYYIEMENFLLDKASTKNLIASNPLGKLMSRDLNIKLSGNLTDTEKFQFYINLVKLRPYFVYEPKKDIDAKTQKQLLSDLINQSSVGDFKERVRIITQICLFDNNRSLDFLRDLLLDKDDKIRDIAFIALQFRKDKQLMKLLKDLIDFAEEEVRVSAITNMLKIKEKKVLDHMLNTMKNESVMVKEIALRALIDEKNKTLKNQPGSYHTKIYNCFIDCLEDDGINIRNLAIDNLIKEPFETTKDILSKAIDNKSTYVRKTACEQIVKNVDNRLIKSALMRTKDDTDLEIKYFSLRNIATRKYAEAPEIIELAVYEGNNDAVMKFISYLLNSNIPKQNVTTKTLEQIVVHHKISNLEFNTHVADVLKKYGDDLVPFLTNVLADDNYTHKASVARFLEHLSTKKAVEQIMNLSTHKDPMLRIYNLAYIQRNRIQKSTRNILDKALNDKDTDVSLKAIEVCMQSDIAVKDYPENFVESVFRTYTDKDIGIVDQPLKTVALLGDQALDKFDMIFDSDSSTTQISSIKLLVEIGSKEAVNKIVELLNHKNENIKRDAYDYMIWVDHPEARNIINRALKEKDEAIRQMAIKKFLKQKISKANLTEKFLKAIITTPITDNEFADSVSNTLLKVPDKAIPIIKTEFKNQPLGTKNYLIKLLALYETKEARDLISYFFKDKDPEIRLYSMNFTRANNKSKLKKILEKAVEDGNAKVRDIALRSLTDNLPVKSYSDKLIGLLVQNFLKRNDLPASRAQAALRKIGKKAIPFLIEGLESNEEYVVRYSAEILGDLQASEATDKLISMLEDSEVQLRRSAAYSLRKIKDQKAKKVMIDSLKDKDLYVRRSVIKGLGDMKCKEAKAILQRIKKSEEKQKYLDKITIGMIDEALAKMK